MTQAAFMISVFKEIASLTESRELAKCTFLQTKLKIFSDAQFHGIDIYNVRLIFIFFHLIEMLFVILFLFNFFNFFIQST